MPLALVALCYFVLFSILEMRPAHRRVAPRARPISPTGSNFE